MRLIYVRHGETDWNHTHQLQGWTDIPLNVQGKKQARQTESLLKNEHIDRIICSPLLRAYQTAEIINRSHGVPLCADVRLRERGFGSLEGKPFSQEDFNQWWKRDFDCRACGMESIASLLARVASLLEELKENDPDETVLLVAHGGTFVAVDSYFNGYPAEDEVVHFVPNCTAVSYLLPAEKICSTR